MKSKLVRNAVRTALAAGALGTVGSLPAAYAQGQAAEDPAKLGKTVVTGSRIKRLDIETAKPVTIISREDIEQSGQPTVADVLRNTTFNSFGEYRETSGNSFAGQALVGLKGLGSTRTLVLLNGRRLPRSPVTANQAIDLNTIPLEAIERIEILTDSASAIYGSDAIGGVINVILRKDYDGMQLMLGGGRPSQEGADTNYGSILMGGSSAKGSYIFSAEAYEKDIIFSRDRPFTKSDAGDGMNIGTTEGYSPFGNTLINYVGPWRADPNCDNVVDPNSGQPLFGGIYADGADEFCTFAYADVSGETTRLKRQSAFINAEYEITPDIVATYTGTVSRVENFGRYAPAVGGFFVDLDQTANPNVPDAWADLGDVNLIGAFDGLLGHRFIGLGPRDDTTINTMWDNQLAFTGAAGMFDWELLVGHTQYDGKNIGLNYAKDSTTVQLVTDGVYNPFDPLSPANDAAYAQMRHTTTRDIEADFTRVSGSVGFDAGELPAGPLGWAVGFDYFDEHFFDTYDAGREGADVIGSAGNSTQGARVNKAVFVEVLVPILNNLEASGALRRDEYNDSSGNETSPYLSVRYNPTDWLLLRGSWGEGFRAPNMTNLYSARSFSAEPGTDTVKCRADGTPLDLCPERQFNSFSGGNPDAKPETSESFNVGAVFGFDNFTAAVDYWNVKIEDGIAISTVQGLINLEFDDRALPPGASITRLPSGQINEVTRPWLNLAVIDYTGVDLRLDYNLETQVGDFDFRVIHSQILEANEQTTVLDPAVDISGQQDSPEFRTNFVIRFNRGDHTITWVTRHIDSYMNSGDEKVASNTLHDIQYAYSLPWDGEISLGLQNISDEDPPLDPFNDTSQPFNSEIYNMDGRISYANYRHRF